MRGEFTTRHGILPNFITDQGELAFLKMICRDDQGLIAGGDNYYVGLCGNAAVAETATLTSITDEVSVANGYARQPILRNSTGWPTIEQINSVYRAVSQVITFSAAGGDYDKSFTRLFLCNVVSGTAGQLFAISKPLTVPFLLVSGQDYPATYALYLG